jgi:hypothetical protein
MYIESWKLWAALIFFLVWTLAFYGWIGRLEKERDRLRARIDYLWNKLPDAARHAEIYGPGTTE